MKQFKDFLTEADLTTIGGTTFTPPFRQSGFWVTDSRKNNLCQCTNDKVAKGLADFLNQKIQG